MHQVFQVRDSRKYPLNMKPGCQLILQQSVNFQRVKHFALQVLLNFVALVLVERPLITLLTP